MSATDAIEQIERKSEANNQQRAHDRNLRSADDRGVEWLREIVESQLDPGTVEVLDNYLSQDFILSKITEAEKDEFRWLLRVKVLKVFRLHPPEGSNVTGWRRSVYYDDPDETLEPLTEQEKMVIQTYADGVFMRVVRSLEGFQQDKATESISVVESRNDRGENDGKRRSRIGGLLP